MKKIIGVVLADSMEYLPFLRMAEEFNAQKCIRRGNQSASFTLKNGDNEVEIIGVECGVGKVCAATATAFLIGDDKADVILNAGLSGAVSQLRREDIVAGESFVECDYDLTAIGYALGEKPDEQTNITFPDEKLMAYAAEIEGIKTAKLGTGDIFLTDSERKKLYKETFGISAFDMETAAIGFACHKAGVPMLSLRKISDDADDSSMDDYREMNNKAEDHLCRLILEIAKKILRDI